MSSISSAQNGAGLHVESLCRRSPIMAPFQRAGQELARATALRKKRGLRSRGETA